MSILITAANSASAYKLKNQLNSDNIIMGDHMDLPDFMLKPGKLIRLPDPKSVSYTHEMLTLCLDMGVEAIYLFRQTEIDLLLKAQILFNEYNIKILVEGNEL
ncbi:hypothetical protein G7092_11325 [Mucilaginibacter sp. HC2]|uniref:hypothetical protein n=1 Tax=Mucilaginibacter inviolabilis TaxID=2714892 RepID=UPI00140B3C8D|nr:hypothetical protein [Mucilaginibacter inviolabilis]NHA04392.1 hypothetical protein [Mucilaginibacter inviolabilis]